MGISIDWPKGTSEISAVAARAMRAKVARAVEKRLRAGFYVLLESTPVWSGDTLANYRVGVGAAITNYRPYNQEFNWQDEEFEAGDREEAAQISLGSLERAIMKIRTNPYQQVIVSNNVIYDTGEGVEALEYGTIGRQAYGMFSRAAQVMRTIDVTGV